MQAEIGCPRISMNPQLYRAATEGDIDLLENFLRPELRQQLQKRNVPIHNANENPELCKSASSGNRNPRLHGADHHLRLEREQQTQQNDSPVTNKGGTVLDRQLNCLLGVTYSGDNALHTAVYFGHVQVAWRICNGNRSLLLMVNNKSETPLHYAAQAGKREIVNHFIHAARREPQPRMTELLRWRNREGETALHQAIYNKHSRVVDILIKADPPLASIPDNNNVSPLYIAVMQNSVSVVALLLTHLGHDVSAGAYAGPKGQTALHAAAFVQKGIAQKILQWKPDLAVAQDDTGSTPLHYAVGANNNGVVLSILENDKTPAYITDFDGLFPIHVAVKLGGIGVVVKLFELCHESDKLLDGQGRNFLHIAVEKRRESLVRWARRNSKLDRSINAKDRAGNTPMHLAVRARHLEIFALLLGSKTLDLGVINKEGLTPYDIAVAQMTHSIYDPQGRDSIIRRTLLGLRSRHGIWRQDHFLNEYKLEEYQKIENEAENLESLAKNTSTVSVLIASASFAGMFTISEAQRAHIGNQSAGLNLAFKAFILTVAYAFICSITATGLCMLATMTFTDVMDRRKRFIGSLRLVQLAIRGLVMAFAFGGYVILTPFSKWVAVLICLTGAVVPILINPMPRAYFILLWALLRSVGWTELRRLWRRGGQNIYYQSFIPWILYYENTLYPGFIIVLVVLLCSLFDFSHHFLVLITVIIIPLSLRILSKLELLLNHVSN